MKKLLLLVIVLPLFLTAAFAQTRDDAKSIQGTWIWVSATKAGQVAPPKAIADLKLVITAKTLAVVDPVEKPQEATYTINPGKNPKEIDIVPPPNPDPKAAPRPTTLGVYEIDGDTMKMAWSKTSRPKSVNDAAAETTILLRREKK